MKLGLEEKAVVCTGAAGGIGRQTAQLLAEEGARVFCVDRTKELAESILVELPGRGHAAYGCDLEDTTAAVHCVDAAVRALGAVEILVHLAAVLIPQPIGEVTVEDWDLQMNVNARATFFLARAAAEHMSAAAGGSILVASSSAWLSGGLPDRLAYAASKGAVTTMVRGLAKTYGPDGVNVNCIAPGLVDTEMMRSGLSDEARANLEAATPLGRFAAPEEIAACVVFLVSPRARFVSGATLNVSGAFTLY
jgi:NAD(P)-dependent dehydrogenase (short-subunit alcohol dehydrogenase family)